MNSFEKRLRNKFPGKDELGAITPGVVVDVHLRGQRKGLIRVGETYPYYDLASLTKIIFTATQSMIYFSEFKSELDLQLKSVLPWWKHRATPAQLLSHTAGLEWWLPMYMKLRGPLKPDVRWAQMKKQLAKVKSAKRKQAVYSDIDLWMMGAFLENRLELPLLDMWEALQERLKLPGIVFHPGNKPKHARSKYAPTEKCSWRGRVMQGEVHDENTWALAGVAPHAGLFGDIRSVSKWGLLLREAWLGDNELFGDPKMVRHFTGRRIPRSVGDWGLGFMKPSRPRASCGKYFSVSSFGHTGFTGTSLWFDPKRDLLVVILSNRVHPTRDNKAFLDLRPAIHNWVVESLG